MPQASTSPSAQWLQAAGAECLALRLRRASDRQAARLRASLRAAGLTDFVPGWWPLFLLVAERPGLSPSEAAASLGLSPAAVSQTAAALRKTGLLTRTGSDRDARGAHLRLSAAGQKCLPALAEAAREANLRLAGALGEDAGPLRRALEAIEGLM